MGGGGFEGGENEAAGYHHRKWPETATSLSFCHPPSLSLSVSHTVAIFLVHLTFFSFSAS